MYMFSYVRIFVLLIVVLIINIGQSRSRVYQQEGRKDAKVTSDSQEIIEDVPDEEIDETLTTYEEDEKEGHNSNHEVIGSHAPRQGTRSIFLVRHRRATTDKDTKWNHDIPYVFDSSYISFGEQTLIIFKRALKQISDHVCVTYHDVTDRWDPNNPNWFTENGFDNNAYLLIKGGGGCVAGSGMGDGAGPKVVQPCTGFNIIIHEMFHTLGGAHVQQGVIRDNYITINTEDIMPNLQNTYGIVDPSTRLHFLNEYFDPISTLMYEAKTWTETGLETYTPIRDDIFKPYLDAPIDDVMFYELSQVFRCNELFCKNSTTDCGPGYHTIVKGKCGCVCPNEYDPETNCKTLKNKASSLLSWPSTPLSLIAGGENNACPPEFDSNPGWFSFTGIWPILQRPVPVLMPSSGNTIFFPLCTKPAPQAATIDWESWPPGGAYCIIKPQGHNCGGAFSEFTLEFQSLGPVECNGTLGDLTVKDNNVTLKLCCRYQEHWALPLILPNANPFRLIAKGACPNVQDMRAYKGMVDLFTATKKAYGDVAPQYYIFAKELQIFQCYYLPPVYGCNQEVTLTLSSRSVTITTPGFDDVREANRRCFYVFKVATNDQIRITFNTYDLHSEDILLVKRYHKWQQANRVSNSDWPRQIVSEKGFLSLEYWSSWDSATQEKGLNFTADLLPAEDSCYDVMTRGADYLGETSISETYEDCLPWAQTTDCSDFPIDGLTSVLLITGHNSCRNPGGHLEQPWCYTHKNGTSCHKRYCDVCNQKSPVDMLRTCDDLQQNDLDFCKSAIQRFGCFHSCGMTQKSTSRARCGRPTIPADGQLLGEAKSSYQEGESVSVTCMSGITSAQNTMVCTSSGWTQLTYACDGGTCQDKIGQGLCEQAMSCYPYFCQHEKFQSLAEENCRKSCGFCDASATCVQPTSSTLTVTSTSPVTTGEVMTFSCTSGYYHVSGNLAQVCSSSQNLLGEGPVCQAKPNALDLNLNLVIKRHSTLPQNTAFLLTHDLYRIPFQARITKWYYYCYTSGLVHFLVYRETGANYTFVGSNSVTCTSGWPWSLNVPEADQISVEKGDIMGVYSPYRDTLYASDCRGAVTEPMPNPYQNAANMAQVKSKPFSGKFCLVPSMAAHLEPV